MSFELIVISLLIMIVGVIFAVTIRSNDKKNMKEYLLDLSVISPEGITYVFDANKWLCAINIQKTNKTEEIAYIDLSSIITGTPIKMELGVSKAWDEFWSSNLYVLDNQNKMYKINIESDNSMNYVGCYEFKEDAENEMIKLMDIFEKNNKEKKYEISN